MKRDREWAVSCGAMNSVGLFDWPAAVTLHAFKKLRKLLGGSLVAPSSYGRDLSERSVANLNYFNTVVTFLRVGTAEGKDIAFLPVEQKFTQIAGRRDIFQ